MRNRDHRFVQCTSREQAHELSLTAEAIGAGRGYHVFRLHVPEVGPMGNLMGAQVGATTDYEFDNALAELAGRTAEDVWLVFTLPEFNAQNVDRTYLFMSVLGGLRNTPMCRDRVRMLAFGVESDRWLLEGNDALRTRWGKPGNPLLCMFLSDDG